jgi:hypothetical protein
MKKMQFLRIAIVVICLGFAFACNKNNSSESDSATTADVQNQSDDQTMVSNEDDAISNDIDGALSSSASVAGASATTTVTSTVTNTSVQSVVNAICDANVTIDTTATTRIVTITYNGSNCWGNRTRSGSIVITAPKAKYWGDPNTAVTIAVNNLKITRTRDGRTVTFNGSKTITNVTGGLLKNLATISGGITHTISGTLSITYNNGKTAEWNVSKKRIFTYNNGIVITTTGTHSDGTNTNIAEWGTNRLGVSFASLITVPRVIAQSCNFRLTGGENKIIDSKGAVATITYGLDASGNPTSCPGAGSYYAKLVYVGAGGKMYTYIFPY